MAAVAATPTRRIEHVMGTVFSFLVNEPGDWAGALGDAARSLRHADAVFSTFRADSQISRLGRGEITESACLPEVREVLALSEDLRILSGGVFDIRAHRADGRPDPTGVVKGWATERAAEVLARAGAHSFGIGAGGDVLLRGAGPSDGVWRVGIRHPHHVDRVVATVVGTDFAVATSGSYERGDHVVDARSGLPPRELLSLTVVGPDLAVADACATAALAMGRQGLRWVDGIEGYGACGVTSDGQLIWTPRFERYMDGERAMDGDRATEVDRAVGTGIGLDEPAP